MSESAKNKETYTSCNDATTEQKEKLIVTLLLEEDIDLYREGLSTTDITVQDLTWNESRKYLYMAMLFKLINSLYLKQKGKLETKDEKHIDLYDGLAVTGEVTNTLFQLNSLNDGMYEFHFLKKNLDNIAAKSKHKCSEVYGPFNVKFTNVYMMTSIAFLALRDLIADKGSKKEVFQTNDLTLCCIFMRNYLLEHYGLCMVNENSLFKPFHCLKKLLYNNDTELIDLHPYLIFQKMIDLAEDAKDDMIDDRLLLMPGKKIENPPKCNVKWNSEETMADKLREYLNDDSDKLLLGGTSFTSAEVIEGAKEPFHVAMSTHASTTTKPSIGSKELVMVACLDPRREWANHGIHIPKILSFYDTSKLNRGCWMNDGVGDAICAHLNTAIYIRSLGDKLHFFSSKCFRELALKIEENLESIAEKTTLPYQEGKWRDGWKRNIKEVVEKLPIICFLVHCGDHWIVLKFQKNGLFPESVYKAYIHDAFHKPWFSYWQHLKK